jgi:hypothetical protein
MMKKTRRRFLESLCMDRYGVPIGGLGKKVDFKSMDSMGLVHLKGITIQYPLDVFCVVHVMMHIDIAVTNRIGLYHFRTNRSRKLFRFLARRKIIEEMLNMFEHRLNPLRPAVLQVEDQPRALASSKEVTP